jgi:hypothetical protein
VCCSQAVADTRWQEQMMQLWWRFAQCCKAGLMAGCRQLFSQCHSVIAGIGPDAGASEGTASLMLNAGSS